MLVLLRKVGEKIVIGNEVEVRVLSVSPRGVKLGITAPLATPVHRQEVAERIARDAAGGWVESEE